MSSHEDDAPSNDYNAVSVNRLSALPRPVHRHILSFLSFKDLVRTSCLSSRWQHLWCETWSRHHDLPRNLKDLSDFLRRRSENSSSVDVLFLVLRPTRLYSVEIAEWLKLASLCSVRDILLVFSPNAGSMTMTSTLYCSSIFSCRDLVRLSLKGLHIHPRSQGSFEGFRFQFLTVINFVEVYIIDDILRDIVSKCQSLWSLQLRSCFSLSKIVLSIDKISRLTIRDCKGVSVVDLGKVLSLNDYLFTGKLPEKCEFSSNTTEKTLNSVHIISNADYSTSVIHRGNNLKKIGNIYNVRRLTLCNVALQEVLKVSISLDTRKFQNLRELQLLMKRMTAECLSNIYCFFNFFECPQLEKLCLELPGNNSLPEAEEDEMPEKPEPATINFEKLTVIEVKYFEGHMNEMKLLKFLMATAAFLDRILIVDRSLPCYLIRFPVSDDHPKRVQEVFGMAKASANAKITFGKYGNI